jgi:hypothetical protein
VLLLALLLLALLLLLLLLQHRALLLLPLQPSALPLLLSLLLLRPSLQLSLLWLLLHRLETAFTDGQVEVKRTALAEAKQRQAVWNGEEQE